jgi:hypothetical protein
MSTTAEQPPGMMNATQAAEYLTVSLAWLRLRTQDGTVPHSKLGRRIVYERSELARWVREQQAPPRRRIA